MKKRKKAGPKAKKRPAKTSKTKKRISAKAPARKKAAPEVSMEKVGEVTHYFPHVKAAAIMVLKDSIKIGDEIYIKGHTTDFKERVKSMQIDHVPTNEGKKSQEIGLLVKSRVRIGDSVYKA